MDQAVMNQAVMDQAVMDQALWALGRGAGVAALELLTVAVATGVLTRSGRPLATLPRFGVVELHKNTALLGSAFVALHVLSLFFDPYAQLRLIDSVLPFVGSYRRFWLGLGTVALDLLIAITVTGIARHRVGVQVFRTVHWAAYALWPVALAHSLGNGTDVGHAWFLAIVALCLVSVAAAVTFRLRDDFLGHHRTRTDIAR
jgi:sulfoxide reductase heme-binding subunit YedZ